MRQSHYRRGDLVVYYKAKIGPHPSPHAHDVHPSPTGEDYGYIVDKYWCVLEQLGDDRLVVTTRRGKQHILLNNDPCLRRARWYERWLYHDRFPKPQPVAAAAQTADEQTHWA